MKNREITYYSLLDRRNLAHIENFADSMSPESFIKLEFDRKWYGHLWIPENNECFLEKVSYFQDIRKLEHFLEEQLCLYAEKLGAGYEKVKGDYYNTYKAHKDWLRHTIFICKNEYSHNKKEIFKEVIKFCEFWKAEFLDSLNPYSTEEERKINKVEPPWNEHTNTKTSDENIHKIRFYKQNILNFFYDEFKKYFPDREQDLLQAINGETISTKLVFQGNQNIIAEVFRRLKYNNHISNSFVEIRDWLCNYFNYYSAKKKKATPLNSDTVYQCLLGKSGKVPSKNNRILNDLDWLPFKTNQTINKEKDL